MKAFLHKLSPSLVVALLLFIWWLFNLLTAATVELANDEAYYWWWATGCGLDWGYYDHPPAVAFMIWLTRWLPGEFGVRFAVTLLQPLYLFLLWRMWVSYRPEVTNKTALIFMAVVFSVPLLQLYGFLALPDAPLLFSATLFIWALLRLKRAPSLLNALLVGVATALIGYSKYQGILLVATGFVVYVTSELTERTNIRKSLILCVIWVVTALLIYMPHLLWLYHHDWAPLRYHLIERSARPYKPVFVLEYLANLAVAFNPLLLYFLVKALICAGKKHYSAHQKFTNSLMFWTLVVYALFFLLASFRGRTQPQWNLVAALPYVWFVMYGYEECFSVKLKKILRWMLYISIVIMICIRILAMFNPMHLEGELWNNRQRCEAIAKVAQERPVVVLHNYTLPCKYIFYTQGEACCIPVYYERDSQWKYTSADSAYVFGPAVAIVQSWCSDKVVPDSGRDPLHYIEIEHYLPLSRICVELLSADVVNDSLSALVRVTNPYPYSISRNDENQLQLRLSTMITSKDEASTITPFDETIPAHSTKDIKVQFALGRMSNSLYDRPLRLGIESHGLTASINSVPTTLTH